MNTSTDVKFWGIRRNKSSKTPSYEVRWTVAGRQRSRSRRTKALAEHFLSELRQAAKRGEPFDVETGLPVSMVKVKQAVTWFSFVVAYVDMKWPHAAAKTRDSLTDALATVTPALVDEDAPGKPDLALLRKALRQYVLPPVARHLPRPADVAAAVAWLERHSLPLAELGKVRNVRLGLDALTLRLDGTPAAPTTIARKRAVFYNVLQYAVDLEELPSNPLDKVKAWRPPKVREVVDRRVVVNPTQARELLTAVTYVGRPDRGRHLRAFFACLYFAGLRPAEALGLRLQDCHLPESGWGRLIISRSKPQANRRWTDTGEAHDDRGLKHRAQGEGRTVPIPPELVAILREHVDEFGVHDDGRLFRTSRGGVVSIATYCEAWQQARILALPPEQVASPLAARPYDLRHAAVSLWLNAGVSAPEVAERAGHGVDVLLRVYAKCIDGGAEIASQRIEDALRM
ncbi:tyrosine-type recombinase/integrase [Thermobispora bispora]|uniref:Integrase family protein n=1 Tax=Thermobispora bispora (strain ATCC 19993 / DSM 43833 / CBS 139.67 / JCM 10125 / KCTC 9307 / NBRC 14880 / R51) TaxID=469371 RepID=D6Y279_THEBD|nr:tyrosine-type recombinase/integrase [Thermobispora bispora]ADG86814.1 integrase family protein [Thermobispora bispora DSM 43833]